MSTRYAVKQGPIVREGVSSPTYGRAYNGTKVSFSIYCTQTGNFILSQYRLQTSLLQSVMHIRKIKRFIIISNSTLLK